MRHRYPLLEVQTSSHRDRISPAAFISIEISTFVHTLQHQNLQCALARLSQTCRLVSTALQHLLSLDRAGRDAGRRILRLVQASRVPGLTHAASTPEKLLGLPVSTQVVLQQLGNLYVAFAINEALVLRATSDIRVWESSTTRPSDR